jgi:hypothetical protein
MDFGKFLLTGLRVLQIVLAAAVIGLASWVTHTIHDIEIRGGVILRVTPLDARQREAWTTFFSVLIGSQTRIWIAIGGASLSFLVALFTTMSTFSKRLRTNRWALVAAELLAMMTMAAAFAASLTLTVKLGPVCASLNSSSSSDLTTFGLMCPIDTGFSIAAGVGWFLIAITGITSLVQTCRMRQQKCCSFEPTASALGMGHEYLAVQPPVARTAIPTIYDPQKPIPSETKGDEEKGFIFEPADMGRRDSESSNGNSDTERDAVVFGDIGTAISGPLDLQSPAQQQQHRPARPWSDMPKRKSASD